MQENDFFQIVLKSLKKEVNIPHAIKAVLEEDKADEFKQSLSRQIKKIDSNIKKVCKDNYEDYISSYLTLANLQEELDEGKNKSMTVFRAIKDINDTFCQRKNEIIEYQLQYKSANEAKMLLLQTQKLFGLMQKIEIFIQNSKLNSAIDSIDQLKHFSILHSDGIKANEHTIKLLSFVQKKNEYFLAKIIQKLDKSFGDWISKIHQKEQSIGLEIIEEIISDLRFVDNENFLMNVSQMQQSPNKSLKQSLYNNPFAVVQTSVSANSPFKKSLGGRILTRESRISQMQEFTPKRDGFYLSRNHPVSRISQLQNNETESSDRYSRFLNSRSSRQSRISRISSFAKRKPQFNVETEIDIDSLDMIFLVNKRLGKEKEFVDFFKMNRRTELILLAEISNDANVQKNLSEILGFLVVQMNICKYFEAISPLEDLENLWNELVTQLERNIDDFLKMCNDSKQILEFKEYFTWFVIATMKIGFSSQNSIIEILRKNLGKFIARLTDDLDAKIQYIIDNEQFTPIYLSDILDYEKYVETYQIKLDREYEIPFSLPYTELVVNLNNEVKHKIQELFNFMRYISTDENDMKSIFDAIDMLILSMKEMLSNYLTNGGQMTMLQNALMKNNIEYFQKSYGYFEDFIFKLTKGSSRNDQLVSWASFDPLKEEYEHAIFKELEVKIDQFISILEGNDWLPKKPSTTHNYYIEDLITWLDNNLRNIETFNSILAANLYVYSFKYYSHKMVEFITNPTSFKKINIIAIYNITLDIKFLEAQFKENHLFKTPTELKESLSSLRQLLNIFLLKEFNDLLDEDKHRFKYGRIQIDSVQKLGEKLKSINLQGINLPKIKKSEITNVLKKLQKKK